MEGDRELVFGDDARRLQPRAVPCAAAAVDPCAPPFDRERARVAVRAGSLTAGERAELARLSGAAPAPFGVGEELLELGAAALRASPLWFARVLLRAHEHATAPLRRPRVVGVLNATPDSFSDGGLHLDPARAAEAAERMVAEGADELDVGGESTRPGALPVPAAEELARVLPVIGAVRARGVRVPLSVDTRRAEVAARALDLGADSVNDTSAGRDDPAMLPLVAERGCPYVVMHARGAPADMQADPRYGDPVSEIAAWLRERAGACLQAGIALHNIALDPGIGFGKRVQDNVALIRRTAELRSLGRPLLVGVSRKRYLGSLTGEAEPARRAGATAAAVALAVACGAERVRVHDVALAAQAAAVAAAHAGLLPETLAAEGTR